MIGQRANAAPPEPKGDVMGLGDKISHKAEELAGKAKAGAGDATDNPDLEAEGRAEEAEANVKQTGDDVADASGTPVALSRATP